MAVKHIKLTDEEKIIKEYYKILVNKKVSKRNYQDTVKKFCKEYIDAVKKKTRFEKEEIGVYADNRERTLGSMSTRENGRESTLTVNFDAYKKLLIKGNEGQRFIGFTELLDTLNHEMQHYMDNKEVENYFMTTRGMSLNKCMEIVSEKLAHSTDSYNFYSSQEGNYENVIMEGDARRTGAIKTSTQLLRTFPKMPIKYKAYLAKKVKKSMKGDNIDFERLKYDNSNERYDRDDVTSAYVDEIMAAKPELLTYRTFDVMTYEYNSDGTRKSFDELVFQRDRIYENVRDNKRINEDTRSALCLQLNTAYSRMMYNSLRRTSPEGLIDLRRRIGDKAFIDELYYIRQGKINSAKEKLKKFEQHIDFLTENKDILSKSFAKEVEKEYQNFYEKSGYKVYIGKNKEEYETLESESMIFLTKLKDNVEKTYDKYPMYTREEIFERNKIRDEKRAKVKETLTKDYVDRQVVIRQKDEAARKKEEEERIKRAQAEREALKKKLKNPIFKLVYNMKHKFDKNKALDEARVGAGESRTINDFATYNYNLSEKRDLVENMQLQKQELEERFEQIVDISKDTLLEAEEKIKEDKSKNVIIEERKEDKKKINMEDKEHVQETR